jgi:hypothetical protein
LAFLRAFLQGNQQGLHLLAAQHGICHQNIHEYPTGRIW